MANRRMFSLDVINTDLFLDMPVSAQCLYFHLGMRADDDGFVSAPKQILRSVACTQDDLRVLISKNFVIPFENGIVVIRHWKQHNYIQSDRYRKTKYTEERSQLKLKENVYILDTEKSQVGHEVEAQYRLSKDIFRDRDSINTICPEPEESAQDQSGILLPLVDNTDYNVPLSKIKKWTEAFPAVDVKQELNKMITWLISNPSRKKTRRGIDRFINNWLTKEQDRGGTYRRQQETKSKKPNNFNNIDQRSYDYADLESQLLGRKE